MKLQQLATALVVAIASYGSSVYADTVVAAGTSQDSVNKSLTVAPGTAVKDVETVNGSIDLGANSIAAGVETVNGSIDVGNDVSVDSLETVNGSIHAGSGLKTTGGVETVNGRIEIGAGSTVQGSVTTVNGRVTLDQVAVTKNTETVNGGLELKNSRIGGNVEMVNGRAEIIDGTIVAGDVTIRKTKGGWSWGSKPKPPILVIGAGSEVRGRIVVENPDAKVFVHESARIGTLEGAQATRYSGSSAPE